MFLDASAVVAILTQEEGADVLIDKIDNYRGSITFSSVTIFEAVIALARKAAVSVYGDQRPTPPVMIAEAQSDVEMFLRSIGASEIDMPNGLYHTALEAAQTYGRFVGHPARLNFGDCFAYAAAKTLKSKLLFIGDDFSRTDIEAA
ncbi:type II toxin-antitoxin system VapC family toxin [Rhizobium terrae]|uniref:type II toxin-antitoxin system VapC family toxin n=1 Tax=Rhizobium terrae TaxID=2171756 RepID=UPI000E3DA3B2|nr:type II toxin-antitoxin system VapC family toxin [Rhizobium terrae]